MDRFVTVATIAANPWNMGLPRNDPRGIPRTLRQSVAAVRHRPSETLSPPAARSCGRSCSPATTYCGRYGASRASGAERVARLNRFVTGWCAYLPGRNPLDVRGGGQVDTP